MEKWTRIQYQPATPLYQGRERVTGSREHIALSRKAAGEGMVLLKNQDKTLPLKKGSRVALFGKGSVDYVKGGGGSGDVTVAYVRSLADGMEQKEAEGKLSLFGPLTEFYRRNVRGQYEEGVLPGMTREPALPRELLEEAAAWADTAVITVCRFSAEGWDRTTEEGKELPTENEEQTARSRELFERGDFYLTNAEAEMVRSVTERFGRVAVVLNTGGMMDTVWIKENPAISAALLAWQGGMEGGLAAADILCGDVNPSGKLADTFARRLEDYPSSEGFHDSADYVEYTEDIYVGYRYFETLSGKKELVSYPFGFGLSYTDFDISVKDCVYREEEAVIRVSVLNTGDRAGKEVVQAYFQAPQGKLGKPALQLGVFEKTRLLSPGEEQVIRLAIPYSQMASYDDTGKVCLSAYVLEEGDYFFYVGNSARNLVKAAEKPWRLEDSRIVAQLSSKAAPKKLSRRLLADGSWEALPTGEYTEEPGMERQDYAQEDGMSPAVRYQPGRRMWGTEGKPAFSLEDVAFGKTDLDTFMDQLSDEDLASLVGGQPNTGVANTFGMGNLPDYGVPNVMTADGPAGLRIKPECGVVTTAWPCATLLACTWNPDLTEQVGRAGAEEVKENNIGIWLTPAINIHRSPLCGRNFEYYSEDPYLTGKMAAAMVRGIQSVHVGASVKHFACNNKETNRKASDSRVSERALREIYLKAFEIVVKEASPYTIMSSYNLLNGVHTSENKDLLTGILRQEWGFAGVVTTDWWTQSENYREVKAGNDIKMAAGYPERILEALKKGYLTKEELRTSARRILELILKMD